MAYEFWVVYETAMAHAILILAVLSLQIPVWAIYFWLKRVKVVIAPQG